MEDDMYTNISKVMDNVKTKEEKLEHESLKDFWRMISEKVEDRILYMSVEMEPPSFLGNESEFENFIEVINEDIQIALDFYRDKGLLLNRYRQHLDKHDIKTSDMNIFVYKEY